MHRRCRGSCGELKPLDQFYASKRGPGGLSPRCKVCDGERLRQLKEAQRARERAAKLNLPYAQRPPKPTYPPPPVSPTSPMTARGQFREALIEACAERRDEIIAA